MSSPSPTETLVAPTPRLRIDSRRRWFPDLGALIRYRRLIVLLSRRDITVKYRQTVLGTVWIFTGPLVSAGLFSLVFGRIAGLSSGGDAYFPFSYAALLGWNLFSTTLTSTSSSLTANSSLITKIYFPRLTLPASTVGSTLLNTAVSFGVMLVLLVIYDLGFTLQLLLLPFWLLLAILLAVGIGAVLSALAVSYRDINYLTPILTSLLIYVSPVAYSFDVVPDSLRTYYLLNPLTTIVEGCRWSVLGEGSLTAWAIAYTIALTIGAVTIGLSLFARLESRFADVI
jgi:lipopolysaccharide transport system permease protein